MDEHTEYRPHASLVPGRASHLLHDSEDITDSDPRRSAVGITLTPAASFPSETAYDSGAYHETYIESPGQIPQRKSPQGSFRSFSGYIEEGDTERLTKGRSTISGKSSFSKYDGGFHPHESCQSHRSFYQGRFHWLSILIITLSVFSTIFSGIYLAVALAAPRYGRYISSAGRLAPSTAAVLTNLFAKLIELSFVAVFVTFLGQVLSRRAISKKAKGITIAELSMRGWILQPATIFTHFTAVRYAGFTVLGLFALVVTLCALLYTTAAQALVTPVLKIGLWDGQPLFGRVRTSFANLDYLRATCTTPFPKLDDALSEYSLELTGTTCVNIEHAAQGMHNYQQYMNYWSTWTNKTTDLRFRPQGMGLLFENTSISASWIHAVDSSEISSKFKRFTNNVTLAYPHANVFTAVRTPESDILQPEELDGLGAYSVKASVPSPFVNVLCANLNRSELSPMVYAGSLNRTTGTSTQPYDGSWQDKVQWSRFANITTAVDDIFGFDASLRPPMFYKYPLAFNTILNASMSTSRQATSLWLLGHGGLNEAADDDYFMCRVEGGLTQVCSTWYSAQSSGGILSAHCEDPTDPFAYSRGGANASAQEVWSPSWFGIASDALQSMSLNNGVSDGNAANARTLTQLQMRRNATDLNPSLPSPAEALAVMVGGSLLLSTEDASFTEYWNHSTPSLNNSILQSFNATVRKQQYASGGTQSYQRAFYPVLILVFLLNVIILIYLIINHGLVTDFSEPPNLFAIALNSPPSEYMAGSCGAGPEGHQYQIAWKVIEENEHLFVAGSMPPPSRHAEKHSGIGLPFSSGRHLNHETQTRGGFTVLRDRTTNHGDQIFNHHNEDRDEEDQLEMHEFNDRRGRDRLAVPPPSSNHHHHRRSTSSSSSSRNRTPRLVQDGVISRVYSKLSKRGSFI